MGVLVDGQWRVEGFEARPAEDGREFSDQPDDRDEITGAKSRASYLGWRLEL